MQIRRGKLDADFLPRLAAGADIGRFADVGFQFPAAGAPPAAIRLLRPFEQQGFVPLVEAKQQRRDFVRQRDYLKRFLSFSISKRNSRRMAS